MSRRQFKAAILEHEAFTGKRNLPARRLFNIMLRGGGVDLQELANVIANVLTSNGIQIHQLGAMLSVNGLHGRVDAMNAAIQEQDYPRLVRELSALLMEHLSSLVVDSTHHPWLAFMIQWTPTMIQWTPTIIKLFNKLVWVHVLSKLENAKMQTLVANKISTLEAHDPDIEKIKWYSLAAELQDDKRNHTVHTQASKTQLRRIAQRNERMEILQSQLTDQGQKNFVELSKQVGQLRRVLTATDVVDVGHWSQTEPAVKFIKDQTEWLGYRKDGTWKLDPTWNSKDPTPGTQFTRIEMGRWINGIFEGTAQYIIEDKIWWQWTSNLKEYLTRIPLYPLYPLRSWRKLILSLQQGGTEQEKALWKVQLKSQLTMSQQKFEEAAKDWAKLRRELQSEDMDFTFAEPVSQVNIVPAVRMKAKVDDKNKEWLFYKDGQSWELDTTWGEQELPADAITMIAIEKGSLRDWFWRGNEKLELDKLDVDTRWLGESLSAYVNRMHTLLQAPAQTQAPSGKKMAEQNEKMMKDKMKLQQFLSTLVSNFLVQ